MAEPGRARSPVWDWRIGRKTYLALCLLACLAPLPILFGLFAWHWPDGAETYTSDAVAAFWGTLAMAVLTYPLGALATLLFVVPPYFGWLTPTESLMAVAPLYALCGYLQWYVLVPRWFRGQRGASLESPGATRASGSKPWVRAAYVAVCVLVCAAPMAATHMAPDGGWPVARLDLRDAVASLAGAWVASVLTFPLGALAALAAWLATWFTDGLRADVLLLAAPLYALCGYLQWFVLIPRALRGAQGPAVVSVTQGQAQTGPTTAR